MPRSESSVVVYASGKCQNSRRLVQGIRQRLPDLSYELVDVSAPRVALPRTLTHVPSVFSKNDGKMYVGTSAFRWLDDTVSAAEKIVDSEACGAMGIGGISLPFSTVDGGLIEAQQPFECL